ncbi:MAG: (2Fe-2S)-binding protein [Deltaproteobacteria bacterium]|nr:(2Fe-2S)-binding protein [Deltaproteobacteria bacterium]
MTTQTGEQISIRVTVNGRVETAELRADRSLLEWLREDLDLTGAKLGCNEGECGACVVLLDGRPVNSCLVLAAEADGREVLTIEGLGRAGALHPLQQAFVDRAAVQCGFCTPGMILCALGLLGENPDPSPDEIRRALAGNLCRCTGYQQIVEAVLDGAGRMREGART